MARPDPPLWGALLTSAIKRAGLSARAAARQAGISEGRWRQITSGYQVVSPGVYAPVHGPAATIARMAVVAGVSAGELTAAGRPDAARALSSSGGHAEADADVVERIRSMDSEQARELLAAIALRLGISVPEDGEERRFGT